MRTFISYRRQDAQQEAHKIYDTFADKFGGKNVFLDVDFIRPGENFRAILKECLDSCYVLLALIGPEWVGAKDNEGNRRLEDPKDYVCLEIASALSEAREVVPLLIRGARMPKPEEMPESIRELSSRQGMPIQDDNNIRQLIWTLRQRWKDWVNQHVRTCQEHAACEATRKLKGGCRARLVSGMGRHCEIAVLAAARDAGMLDQELVQGRREYAKHLRAGLKGDTADDDWAIHASKAAEGRGPSVKDPINMGNARVTKERGQGGDRYFVRCPAAASQ